MGLHFFFILFSQTDLESFHRQGLNKLINSSGRPCSEFSYIDGFEMTEKVRSNQRLLYIQVVTKHLLLELLQNVFILVTHVESGVGAVLII